MLSEKLQQLNYKKLIGIFSGVFLFGIIYGWIIFPLVFKVMLKHQVALRPGGDIRKMWEIIPFHLDYKMFLFNITNPDGVMNGDKPILKEIGPYFFEEWKTKEQIVDDKEEDTTTFYTKDTFIFRPDLSGNGLTGEEQITILHPLVVGTALFIKKTRAPMLPIVSKAIEIIFNPKSPFVTISAMDILFRGFSVDCSSHEFASKAVCAAFETEVTGMEKTNDTHFKFSFFGTTNATETQKLSVFRGLKNLKDLGRVVRHQDEPEMDVWSTDECNQFKGTDGTIFPPGLTKEEGIWAFIPSLCRGMQAKFEEESSYVGISTGRFGIDFGDPRNDESLQCYCRDSDSCPPKGTFDLSNCVGAPLIASLPHFYKCDPQLLENVSGMTPDKNIHATQIDFEAMSGTPLTAANRLQFNWDLEPVEEVEVLKNVPQIIFPIFWIEEGLQLNKTFTNMLKYQMFLPLKLSAGFKWTTIVVGFIGMCLSAYGQYLRRNSTMAVSPVIKTLPQGEDIQHSPKSVKGISNANGDTKNNSELSSKLEAKLNNLHNAVSHKY